MLAHERRRVNGIFTGIFTYAMIRAMPKQEQLCLPFIEPGDLVQWESQDMLMFNSPRQVEWVSDDGQWVMVEGSKAGLPISQLILSNP
jgi:hypothetical protein